MIAITLPAYNLQENGGGYRWNPHNYFIHVQDDASTDDTKRICIEKECIVNSNPKRLGLAETFRNELSNCLKNNADTIVHIDSDGQYMPSQIPDLLEKIDEGNDLVVGSRFMNGIEYKGSKFKTYGNIIFTHFICFISNSKCTDVTSGFRAMTKKTAQEIRIKSKFTYTYCQLMAAKKLNLKVCEVPIKGRETRKSKLMKTPLHYIVNALIDIIFYCH